MVGWSRWLLWIFVLGGCAASTTASAAGTPVEIRPPVVVPLSLHVLVDADDPASELSSGRTIEDLALIAVGMVDIWEQADVVFDPLTVHRVAVPAQVLEGIALGDTSMFFQEFGQSFDVPDSEGIVGFYVREAFGVNGFTPPGSRAFFVVDEPTVHDERVSSHEVGHIFGLRHARNEQKRLMFSGTNGMTLDDAEQTVARYGAEGLLE